MNETSFKPIPESAVTIQNTVIVLAGCLESKDSVQVSVSPVGLEEGEYLLPLSISDIKSSDAGIRASSTASTLYYRIKVKFAYLADIKSPVVGAVVSRQNWTISSNQSSGVEKLIDGEKETYWQGARNAENNIVVDMKEIHELKGINIYYKAMHTNYFPKVFQIYASEDGEKWIDMGKTEVYKAKMETELGVNFLGKVKMRYFKLFPKSFYVRPQINELEAIK